MYILRSDYSNPLLFCSFQTLSSTLLSTYLTPYVSFSHLCHFVLFCDEMGLFNAVCVFGAINWILMVSKWYTDKDNSFLYSRIY